MCSGRPASSPQTVRGTSQRGIGFRHESHEKQRLVATDVQKANANRPTPGRRQRLLHLSRKLLAVGRRDTPQVGSLDSVQASSLGTVLDGPARILATAHIRRDRDRHLVSGDSRARSRGSPR
jgi:hypothetical protein